VRKVKSGFGVIAALLPVLYCGGLLYYFIDTSGSIHQASEIGLGPTLAGLAAVGLLFCIPLFLKIARFLSGPRSPGSDGSGGPDKSGSGGESGFDAAAVVDRYLASRPAEHASAPVIAPRATQVAAPGKRSGFGRKSG
jgi:hypothetical protein